MQDGGRWEDDVVRRLYCFQGSDGEFMSITQIPPRSRSESQVPLDRQIGLRQLRHFQRNRPSQSPAFTTN